jgi:hypothetical protein
MQNPTKPGDTLRFGVQTIPPGTTPLLDSGWYLVIEQHPGTSSLERLTGSGTLQAVFGREFVAIQLEDRTWTVLNPNHTLRAELTPPASAKVIGLWDAGLSGQGPELLLLESDQRTIAFAGRSTSRVLPKSSAPIVDVAINPWRGQLAYATSEGEVVFHVLHDTTPFGRFVPE